MNGGIIDFSEKVCKEGLDGASSLALLLNVKCENDIDSDAFCANDGTFCVA